MYGERSLFWNTTRVLNSYLAAALVVAILITWIALDYRSQKQRLRELDQSGVIRRSGRGAAEMT